MNRTFRLAALLVLAACSSGPPRDVPAGPALGRYTDAQVVEEAKSLTTAYGMPEDRRREILAELDRLLADKEFSAIVKEKGISGVCAYSSGSGGLLIAGGGAKGLASFAGGGTAVPFRASATAIGAYAGGQASWGIGVVVGLAHEAWFPGEYDGTSVASTAVETSLAGARYTSEWHDHTMRVVAAGVGLMAAAGHVELTVAWRTE
jgi:hypothetical protein